MKVIVCVDKKTKQKRGLMAMKKVELQTIDLPYRSIT